MPGLVGLITKMPRERAEGEMRRMVASIRHEPWYATGTWSDESLGLYVGWVERNGRFTSCMPFQNEQRDLALVFSGEEFPEQGVAQRLKGRGHATCDEGPSYLVHLAEEDPDFLKSVNGRFQGVLANRRQGTVTLFNDRYGLHRLYYYKDKEAFYFAVEAKAILAIRPESRSIDSKGLAEFVSCGCTLENRTFFKNIKLLPPASAWTFRQGKSERKGAYFDPKEWEEQSLLEPEPYYRQLRAAFSGILPRYFEGPERIGVSLTGGLDSRMIMSWRKAAPGSLPCYSFGGMLRDSQDVQIARRVAGLCGQDHEVIRVGEEFLSQFPHYSERVVYLTDGCVDVRNSSDLYINQKARQIAPIRMTGNFGGEVLRRVRSFKAEDPVPGLFHPEFCPHVEEAKETYRGLIQAHPLTFALFRQAPWHHYGLISLEETQVSLRSPFLDNEFVRTVFRAPQSAMTNDDLSLRLIGDGSPALRRLRTDRGLGGSLPGWAAALQRAYFGFTFKAEYACDLGMPQRLSGYDRALASLHLERIFLGRHKFYHYRLWYRDALRNYVREMLLDSRTLSRPYLQRVALERIVFEHLAGKRNYTTTIHKILTLEYLHRLFIDAI